jgi:hypothetical protein
MAPILEETLANARRLAQLEVCIWFAAWSIRRRGELDEKLDRAALALRWVVAVAGWLLASRPGPGYVRAVALILSLAFLCWPNLAWHTVSLARRLRSSPPATK